MQDENQADMSGQVEAPNSTQLYRQRPGSVAQGFLEIAAHVRTIRMSHFGVANLNLEGSSVTALLATSPRDREYRESN